MIKETIDLQSMKRICVIGSPGSGKSTLSHGIHKALGIPWIRMSDLDLEFERDLGRPLSASEWSDQLIFKLQQERWLTDGYVKKSLDTRFTLADVIIFLDFPIYVCLYSAAKRGLFNLFNVSGIAHSDYKGTYFTRLKYFFGWRVYRRIIEFHSSRRTELMNRLVREKDKVLIFQSRQEVNRFIESLSRQAMKMEGER